MYQYDENEFLPDVDPDAIDWIENSEKKYAHHEEREEDYEE